MEVQNVHQVLEANGIFSGTNRPLGELNSPESKAAQAARSIAFEIISKSSDLLWVDYLAKIVLSNIDKHFDIENLFFSDMQFIEWAESESPRELALYYLESINGVNRHKGRLLNLDIGRFTLDVLDLVHGLHPDPGSSTDAQKERYEYLSKTIGENDSLNRGADIFGVMRFALSNEAQRYFHIGPVSMIDMRIDCGIPNDIVIKTISRISEAQRQSLGTLIKNFQSGKSWGRQEGDYARLIEELRRFDFIEGVYFTAVRFTAIDAFSMDRDEYYNEEVLPYTARHSVQAAVVRQVYEDYVKDVFQREGKLDDLSDDEISHLIQRALHSGEFHPTFEISSALLQITPDGVRFQQVEENLSISKELGQRTPSVKNELYKRRIPPRQELPDCPLFDYDSIENGVDGHFLITHFDVPRELRQASVGEIALYLLGEGIITSEQMFVLLFGRSKNKETQTDYSVAWGNIGFTSPESPGLLHRSPHPSASRNGVQSNSKRNREKPLQGGVKERETIQLALFEP